MRLSPLLFAAACAPVYRPPAPFVPMLEQRGDAQVAAHLGAASGLQVDGAVAPTDALALRGGVQVAGYASEGEYGVGTFGVGWYGADPHGLRGGVSLAGGGGYSRGVTDWTVSRQTATDGQTTSEQVRFQNSGPIAVGALRGEIGYELEGFALGATTGLSLHQVWHDRRSDGSGVGRMGIWEAAGLVRFGPPPVGFEGFVGTAMPFWSEGDVGIPFPVTFGLGLTVDASTLPR